MSDSSDKLDRVADDLAHRHGLGARHASTPLKAGSDIVGGLILLALGVGGVVLLVSLGVPTTGGGAVGTLALALGALLFLASGAGLLRTGASSRGRRLHACAHGLVVELAGGPAPVPYTELMICRHQIDYQRSRTVVTSTVNWKLTQRHGTPWALDLVTEPTDGLQTFLDAALANACAAQAEPQAAALAGGGTVTFGDVSFSATRLRFRSHDVAWADVLAVDLAAGAVTATVSRPGRTLNELPYTVGGAGTIPNFALFWPLFRQTFQSRPGAPPATTTATAPAAHTAGSKPVPPAEGAGGAPTSGSSGPDAGSRST